MDWLALQELHPISIALLLYCIYIAMILSIVLCSVIAIVFIPMNTSLCNVVAFDFHDIIPQKCVHFFPLQINTKSTKTKYKIQQNKKYTTTNTKYKNECPAFHFRSIHKHQLQKDCSLQRTVLCSLQVLCTVLCTL